MTRRRMDGTPADKVAAYTERQQNGCLLWMGASTDPAKRRGMIRDGDKVLSAHRVHWEGERGPIPPGYCLRSTCPAGHGLLCIEPDHMALGTQGDVNRQTVANGRRSRRKRRSMVAGDL